MIWGIGYAVLLVLALGFNFCVTYRNREADDIMNDYYERSQ